MSSLEPIRMRTKGRIDGLGVRDVLAQHFGQQVLLHRLAVPLDSV